MISSRRVSHIVEMILLILNGLDQFRMTMVAFKPFVGSMLRFGTLFSSRKIEIMEMTPIRALKWKKVSIAFCKGRVIRGMVDVVALKDG